MREKEEKNRVLPGPSGAFADEIVAGEDEFIRGEEPLLPVSGDRSGRGDPLHCSFESLVQSLLQRHGRGGACGTGSEQGTQSQGC